MDKIPLNYEASEGDTHKQTCTALPQEVVQCLENARFVSCRYDPPLSTTANSINSFISQHRPIMFPMYR